MWWYDDVILQRTLLDSGSTPWSIQSPETFWVSQHLVHRAGSNEPTMNDDGTSGASGAKKKKVRGGHRAHLTKLFAEIVVIVGVIITPAVNLSAGHFRPLTFHTCLTSLRGGRGDQSFLRRCSDDRDRVCVDPPPHRVIAPSYPTPCCYHPRPPYPVALN